MTIISWPDGEHFDEQDGITVEAFSLLRAVTQGFLEHQKQTKQRTG